MKALLRSFAGGEITPELYGRLDLGKYQTGLAKILNFTVLPHGPVSRRPGTRFVIEARDSTKRVRLIPFAFNALQTAVLEFGHQYIRFHIAGSTLLEANKTVVSIVGSTVTVTAHGWATGDDVFIGGRYHRITVTGADTFTTADIWGVATTATGTTAARVYTIASPYTESDLFSIHYAQDSDILSLVSQAHAARELRRLAAANWQLTSISFAPPASPVNPPAVAVTSLAGTAEPQSYVYTYVTGDGVTESLPSPPQAASCALSTKGNYNTVTLPAVLGANRYNLYKLRGGTYGYIGTTASLTIIDDNILPDTLKTPPEDIIALNSTTGDYPSATTYHEQRRWFAGTSGKPQTIFATRNAADSNLTSSAAAQDDDALEFRIRSRQQNAIRHLLPLSDLIALTVGGEFRIFSDGAPAITPTSLSVKPQGYNGAADVQPALASGAILYVQSQGSRVREMAYNWQASAYASIDISIMAPHLFNGYTVVDLAYVRAPVPTLWCVRSDGVLLGMTYVPEQQVYAWHQHDTDGVVESAAVVSEGDEDVLYIVVKRTVNGRDVRYIERLQSRIFTDQADAFYVDSALTYDGAPVTTLSGLHHLEGKTVQVLTDGAVHPQRTVTAGAITLDGPASVVHVGLAYVSDMVTLPLAIEQAEAGGQGATKNVNGVAMRVTQSSLVKAGPNFGELTEYPARDVTDPYDGPPSLRTGELRFDIAPDWNSDGSICVRQDEPLPLTVLSIAVDVAPGG